MISYTLLFLLFHYILMFSISSFHTFTLFSFSLAGTFTALMYNFTLIILFHCAIYIDHCTWFIYSYYICWFSLFYFLCMSSDPCFHFKLFINFFHFYITISSTMVGGQVRPWEEVGFHVISSLGQSSSTHWDGQPPVFGSTVD